MVTRTKAAEREPRMTELERKLLDSLRQLIAQQELQVTQLANALQEQTHHYEQQLIVWADQVQTLTGLQRSQATQIEQLTEHVKLLTDQFQE